MHQFRVLLKSLDEVEKAAARYSQLKKDAHGNKAGVVELASQIIDFISRPQFAFPIREEVLVNSTGTTFVFENAATFPDTFDFLAEVLHCRIPIQMGAATFGPGEIIVHKRDRTEAYSLLQSSIKELQKVIHARRSEIVSKHTIEP